MNIRLNGAAPRALIGTVRADASDPKVLVGQLQAAFEEFKAKNDARLAQAEKRGEDAVTKDEVQNLTSAIGDLQAALDAQAMKIAANQVNPGERQIRDPEYTSAFQAHVRKGEVQASLNKGTDADGGYVAPVEWDRTVADKLVQIDPMRSICTVQSVSGQGFKKLFNQKGLTSGWVGETAARPETSTSTFGEMSYAWGEVYANPAASQGMLDDAEINIEAFLAGEVAQEFAYREGIAFVSGDGANKPKGLLTYVDGGASAAEHPHGAIPAVDTAGVGALAADDIANLPFELPGERTAGARYAMNRNTLASVMLLKDGQGNYLWQPSYVAGQPQTIRGYPVTEIPSLPDVAAGAKSVLFGNFAQTYIILDRLGIRVLRDPFTNKPFVHFYSTKRVGGGLLSPEWMVALNVRSV